MAFKDTTLVFTDNAIATDDGRSVMMRWEAPIMEKSAEYICQSKGDILEIGFGMGICSDFIQAQDVNSHTIIEIHPQVIEKLKIWAEDKDNVIIIEGDWYSVNGLSTYDGIFIDTYGGENWDKFKEFALSKGKSGAKVTYWNVDSAENEHGFDNISHEDVSIVPEDEYHIWYDNTYHLPKVVI